MTEVAVSSERLVKRYGRVTALDGLDIEVRTGEVYGFLGPNGAGKTTTIRLMLDLIRPSSGHVSVLGLDPTKEGLDLRRRTGFLGGDFVVDGRQTSRELLTYLGNLRGGVSATVIEEFAGRLDLDLNRPIKALSRGNRQKVGVIQAFMHEPELLVLDEPTTGLDPFLQHEFAAMVRQAAAEGRTVFMSSHVMSEVQRTADRVGIIREGRLTSVESVEDLRSRARRRIEIVFDTPVSGEQFARIPGVSNVRVDGNILRCRLDGRADDLIKTASGFGVATFLAEEPDLEELFFDRFNGDEDAS
jgi:ABC-2 type transport system ATP-binding protein